MAIVLATVSAILFGAADFSGGLASRRNSAMTVVVFSQIAGLVGALAASVLLGSPFPGTADLLWGAVAGLGGAAGLVLLYHGLANTVVAVVSPIAAAAGAAVPVLFGLATGERPATLAWVGIVVAIPAIVLLLREPPQAEVGVAGTDDPPGGQPRLPGATLSQPAQNTPAGRTRRAALFGAAAGIGFGLFFIAISRVSEAAGLWPLAAARIVSVALVGTLVIARRRPLRLAEGTLGITVLAGVLDMAANVAFLLASRGTLLSIAAVVTSLYPAPTVILGIIVFKEKVTLPRVAGLVLAIASVSLISWR